MRLDVDTSRVALLADAFGANIKQMQAAELRALNKTMTWLRTHTVRAVSKETKVAAKILRQRVAAYKANRRNPRGRVWAGLDPIKARRLGRFRQLKRGVRMGRHVFEGAFLTAMQTGHTSIFERTGEAKRMMKRGRYAGKDIKREPIREVKLDINTDAVQDKIDAVFGEAQARFFIALRQELKYQVFIKNAR